MQTTPAVRSIEGFKAENKLKIFGNGAINPQRAERCGYKEKAFLSPQVQSTSSGLITGPSLLEFNIRNTKLLNQSEMKSIFWI